MSRELAKGPNTGSTIHEEEFSSLTGFMKSIRAKESTNSEYGKQWEVILEDEEGETSTLQFAYSFLYARNFIKSLVNIDPKKQVEIGCYGAKDTFEGKEKTNTKLYLKQDGEFVKMKFTKANPEGCPEPLDSSDNNGKPIKVYANVMQFLEAHIVENIDPYLRGADARVSSEEVDAEENDDMPF